MGKNSQEKQNSGRGVPCAVLASENADALLCLNVWIFQKENVFVY